MNILSVQSHVAYGYVGNRAAVFPLQRLGFEVWAINTVQFSNHTGYGSWTGQVFDAAHVADLIEGIFARTTPADCSAVLSGYLGDADLGKAILSAVSRVRSANPRALYLCDPVMGDVDRGLFVRPGIPEFLRERAVPAADIVTPNQFELELLTGRSSTDLPGALAAARTLIDRGPKIVLVTSFRQTQAAPHSIEMLAVTADHAWLVTTPLLPFELPPNGAGDLVAALFLAQRLKGVSVAESLGTVASQVYAVMECTFELCSRELQLVAAQEQLVRPVHVFPVHTVE